MAKLRHKLGNSIDAYLNYYGSQPNANKGLIIKFINLSIELDHNELFEEIKKQLEFTSNPPKEIECKNGCSHCCSMNVYIFDFEASIIADYLQDNFTEAEIEEIKQKANQKNETTSQLSYQDKINYRFPCSLLNQETGSCRVYDVRPTKCRAFNSTSVANCIAAIVELKKIKSNSIWKEALQTGKDIEIGVSLGLMYKNKDSKTRQNTLEYQISKALENIE